MKVQFFFQEDGFPWVRSDLAANGVDLLELLLASDLSNVERIREFEIEVLKKKKTWWFNASKVEIDNDRVRISSAFDIDAYREIDFVQLKKVVRDWKEFISSDG